MEVELKSIRYSINTSTRVQFINIDEFIKETIAENEIKNGICTIFIPHTTAGVTINENADPDVTTDMKMEVNKLIPFNDNYQHIEGNSAAHIKSSLFGPSLTIIIENGEMLLGTWQSVYFAEFDGPRSRSILVKFIEDKV